MRKTVFTNEEYYHIYNRGVDKREVFLGEDDYKRFLMCLREFNRIDPIGSLYEKTLRERKGLSPHGGDLVPMVEIIAYCLNPNHFHIILKQLQENGISKFMLKTSTGYTTYFNKKYKRSGSLFQGPFKAIHVDSNEYLLYLSAYVNRNYAIHGYGNCNQKDDALENNKWKYCSALDYLGKRNGTLCNKDVVLNQFKRGLSPHNGDLVPVSETDFDMFKNYEMFLNDNAQYLKDKKELEKYCLE